MRLLIIAQSSKAGWVKDYFPDIHPYLLKIVNKPLLEYFIDFAVLLSINEIRIISDNSQSPIEKWFADGSKWGVKISYNLAKPEDNLLQVYLKNYSFCKEDSLLILNGFFFINYNKRSTSALSECFSEKGFSLTNKSIIYLRPGEKLNTLEEIPQSCSHFPNLTILDNVITYFHLNMDIIKNRNKDFVLPGYSNEEDAFYGTNLIFPHSVEFEKPLMIGNNVRLAKFTYIGGCSIIGDNTLIDEGSQIKNSIIYDNTYVGAELEIVDKIVYKNRLISSQNGEYLIIQDKFLLSQVEKGIILSFFDKLLQTLIALLFIILGLIPWLLLYPIYMLLVPKKKRQSEFFLSKSYRAAYFDNPELIQKHLWGKLLLRLSLDKYKLLFYALQNRLLIVGNRLFPTTIHYHKLIKELPYYTPGVFSFAECVGPVSEDTEGFLELEYLNKRCWRSNLKILVKFLLKRLIYGYK